MYWIWIVLAIILGLYLLGRLYFYVLAYAFYQELRPNTPEESVQRVKNILEYIFIDEYEVLEHESRNNHGDKPMKIELLLSENAFNDLMIFISTKTAGVTEKWSEDKETKFSETINKNDASYAVYYSVSHGGYTEHSAGLVLEYDSRKLRYSHTNY
jgi:hypothetical protein